MSSPPAEPLGAEAVFRQAFERLKAGEPKVLPQGSPVTQNNVAREAGRDPSALKKARYPTLIGEIQAYVDLHKGNEQAAGKRDKKHRAKRSMEERLNAAIRQRDEVQSILGSANMRIVELTGEVKSLQQQLDELRPPPTHLGRR